MAVINPIPPLPPRTEALPAPLTGGVYLMVGPNKMFRSIGVAVLASHTNDVIAVDAVDGVGAHLTYNVQDDQTTYVNYHPQLNQSQLRFYSIGGMATWCSTVGANIINSAGLLFAEGGAHVFGFELCNSNSLQDHNNYTTIRTVNGDQTARFCYIHDNADGILGDSLGGRYLVDYCELDNNGVDNFSHNLYLGPTTITVVSNTWSRRCFEGHLVKSRAASTIVRNCILTQENSASNFVVDCGNAGNLIVENCVIQQSFNASNGCSIHYGGEGTSNASYAYLPNQLVVRGNTFIDNYGNFFDGVEWVNNIDPMNLSAYVACVNNTNADPKWNGVAVNVTGLFEDNLLWHVANTQIVGAGGAPVTVSNNGTLDNAPTWSTIPPWTYAPTYLAPTSIGPLVIDNALASQIVVYASALPLSVTINDPASGANLYSPTGTAGLTVTNNAGSNALTTSSGTTNTLLINGVSGGPCTLISAGTDTVTIAAGISSAAAITSTGALTVTSGNTTTYTLVVNGGTATVTCGYTCTPSVGASGTLILTQTLATSNVTVTKAAGGVATLIGAAGSDAPGPGSAKMAGGAGTISTPNTTDSVYTTSTDTAGQTITYGAGNNISTVGTGPNTFIFNSGTVTTTNITGFNTSPKDTITLHGYAGSPVVTHPSGNTVATLSDGSVITFVGVNITVP